MALSEHYDLNYLDPEEEISEFPNQWDHNIDKIDEAIHDAATNDVDLDRLPNLPASQTTSGVFAISRIPSLSASKINSGRFTEARMPSDILDRLDNLERSTGARNLTEHTDEVEITGGALYVVRVGNCVTVTFDQVKVENETGGWRRFCTSMPVGFRPIVDQRENLISAESGQQLAIYKTGSIYANANEDYTYRNTITYVTADAWPSSLPGDPA